jgi:RimJ/RimL family protein N-acetyltransferase
MNARIALRPATLDDAKLLLEWRNDPSTRSQSLDSNVIELEPHVAWLSRRLDDPVNCRVYVAERDGAPFGQLRVERVAAAQGIVSVSIAAAARGVGLGVELIESGTQRAAAELTLTQVTAIVKENNLASLRAFTKAGYRETRRDDKDHNVVILDWRASRAD